MLPQVPGIWFVLHIVHWHHVWNRLVLDKIDFAEQRESNVSRKNSALWSSAQNIKHGQFQLSAWSPTVSYLNAQFFHIISLAFGWRSLRCSTPGHKPMSNIWLLIMLAGQSGLVHTGQENLSVINKVKWIWPHQVFNPDARRYNDFETDCHYRWWQMCRVECINICICKHLNGYALVITSKECRFCRETL